MGALKPQHLLILVLVIVILFGWKKLPDAARSLGRSLRIFKSEVEEMKKDGKAPPSAASSDTVKGETVQPNADPHSDRTWTPTQSPNQGPTQSPNASQAAGQSEREAHNQPPV